MVDVFFLSLIYIIFSKKLYLNIHKKIIELNDVSLNFSDISGVPFDTTLHTTLKSVGRFNQTLFLLTFYAITKWVMFSFFPSHEHL